MNEGLDRLSVTVLAEDTVGYDRALLGQHGLSLFIEAELNGEKHSIMIDVGQNHDALRYNMECLDIGPRSVDAIVLTHCHYDHTGGLAEMVKAVGKPGLPVIGHPGTFRPHIASRPFVRNVGVGQEDSREKLEQAGACVYLTRDPFEIMPGLQTTGEVPRETAFEEPGLSLSTIEEGRVVDDLIMDDISVVARVRDKGLVVLTGCSHAGIVNITRHALNLTGEKKVEGILGGLHLVGATADRIHKTVDALAQLGPGWIAAGHCTGFGAQAALSAAFGDRFSPLCCGFRLAV